MTRIDVTNSLLRISEHKLINREPILVCSLDGPTTGLYLVDPPTHGPYSIKSNMEVSGWAVGLKDPVSSIVFMSNDIVFKQVLLHKSRPDVVQALGLPKSQMLCGFKTKLPLGSLPRDFELSLHAVFPQGNSITFATISGKWRDLGVASEVLNPVEVLEQIAVLAKSMNEE
jgi:hypothetical protein